MSIERKIKQRAKRRQLRVRSKLRLQGLPRISVFRSLNHIYAQIIDDANHKTLVSCSTMELKSIKNNKDAARAVGLELARKALEKNISKAIFDRGSYLYHGRVQALADGLREGGVTI